MGGGGVKGAGGEGRGGKGGEEKGREGKGRDEQGKREKWRGKQRLEHYQTAPQSVWPCRGYGDGGKS